MEGMCVEAIGDESVHDAALPNTTIPKENALQKDVLGRGRGTGTTHPQQSQILLLTVCGGVDLTSECPSIHCP